MAAASAWDELASELTTTAASYSSVISELTSQEWLGPSSASMATAAGPYAAWMSTTAAQAEQAAAQAQAAASAYEAAFAMTVPPTVFAADGAASVTVTPEPTELKPCDSTTAVDLVHDGALITRATKDI